MEDGADVSSSPRRAGCRRTRSGTPTSPRTRTPGSASRARRTAPSAPGPRRRTSASALWPRLVEMYDDFAKYEKWTERTIPVVVLGAPLTHAGVHQGRARRRRSSTTRPSSRSARAAATGRRSATCSPRTSTTPSTRTARWTAARPCAPGSRRSWRRSRTCASPRTGGLRRGERRRRHPHQEPARPPDRPRRRAVLVPELDPARLRRRQPLVLGGGHLQPEPGRGPGRRGLAQGRRQARDRQDPQPELTHVVEPRAARRACRNLASRGRTAHAVVRHRRR